MSDLSKQLKSLTSLERRASAQISRFTLIRLTVIVFCVFAFSRAFERTQSGDISTTVADISNLNTSSHRMDVHNVCSVGGTTFDEQPGFLMPGFIPKSADDFKAVKQEELKSKLNSQCSEAYSLPLTLAGFTLQFDLRAWIFLFPFAFILSEVYLQILRSTRAIFGLTGTYCVTKEDGVGASITDRIFYLTSSREISPFAAYPSRFLDAIIALCTLATVIKFIVESRSTWGDYGPDIGDSGFGIYTYLIAVGAICWYGCLYYRFVRSRFALHLSKTLGLQVPQDRISKASAKILSAFKRLMSQRRALITGGSLVLLSLFTGTGLVGCDAAPGYKLLRSKDDIVWPTFNDSWHRASSVYYLCLVLFAILTLLIGLVKYKFPQTGRKGLLVSLQALAGALAMFNIIDAALIPYFGPPYDAQVGVSASVITCCVVVMLWWITDRPQERSIYGPKIRRILVSVFTPVVFALVLPITIAISSGLYGWLCCLMGLQLIWYGYTGVYTNGMDLFYSSENTLVRVPEDQREIVPSGQASMGREAP